MKHLLVHRDCERIFILGINADHGALFRTEKNELEQSF